jgi:hypothetical protein
LGFIILGDVGEREGWRGMREIRGGMGRSEMGWGRGEEEGGRGDGVLTFYRKSYCGGRTGRG